MKANSIPSVDRSWQITIHEPTAFRSKAIEVVDSGRTSLPSGPNQSPGHGRRSGAVNSMLNAKRGHTVDFAADATLAGQVLEDVIGLLKAEGTPDRRTQDFLMACADRAGAQAPERASDPNVLVRERARGSDSPLSAETRAWLLSVPPLGDTLSDLVQRLCVAKAHLEVDPLFARMLAGSVHSATNLRGQFGQNDFVRQGLGQIAFSIDAMDGVAAQASSRRSDVS